MKMRICIILLSMLLFTISSSVFSADYDRAFVEVFGLGSFGSAKSPLRSGSNEVYARVNSKCNQPRASGTNPHQGTDLQASAGTNVYPIFAGKVSAVNHDTSGQLGYVIINHDIDGNGTLDYYYVKYLHIDPTGSAQTGIKVGDDVTTSTIIGMVDIQRPGGFPPHLHFERCLSDGSWKYKLYNFYRWVTEWNYGSDMDFISGDAYVGNELYITGYACTDNSTNRYTLSSLKLYYKIGSSGTWQTTPKEFSVFNPSMYRWYINLKTATGASTGQTVYYYLVGVRDTDPTFEGAYRHSIWPQYYQHPSYPLSSTYANTICTSFTIR